MNCTQTGTFRLIAVQAQGSQVSLKDLRLCKVFQVSLSLVSLNKLQICMQLVRTKSSEQITKVIAKPMLNE